MIETEELVKLREGLLFYDGNMGVQYPHLAVVFDAARKHYTYLLRVHKQVDDFIKQSQKTEMPDSYYTSGG